MAGNWSSLVAECMPHIDWQQGGSTLCHPPTPQDRQTVLVLLADFFFPFGGELSSFTAGAGVKADKHRQNFKNCCHSPTDVHYVSGALRFTA